MYIKETILLAIHKYLTSIKQKHTKIM